MQIFVPEVFVAAGLTEAVGENHGAVRAARVPGHALSVDADALRIALVPAAGSAAGVLWSAGEEAADRVHFVMSAFGAHPETIPVVADGEEAQVRGFVVEAAGAGGDPVPDAAFLREVVREVLGHVGGITAERLPALMHGIGFRALARLRGQGSHRPSPLGAGLEAGAVDVIETAYPYADYFGVEAMRLRHRRFDGGWSPPVARAVLTSGDAVTVLPFDPGRGLLLLIEQFRPGPVARRDPQPWCLEAVAGRCDGLESPEAAARREAGEEAGLTLGRIERVAAYYPSPGVASEYITAFVGEADLGTAGGLHGVESEHEDIRAIVISLDEARAAVARGEVNNAPLLVSLQWLDLHHARLAAAWRVPAAT